MTHIIKSSVKWFIGFSQIIALVVLILFVTTNSIWLIQSKSQAQILGIQTNLSESQIFSLINLQRQKQGLPTLTPHQLLNQAAYQKAQDMLSTNNFDHYYQSAGTDITPWQFITSQGYEYLYAGENLARHFFDSQTLVQAWLDSPPHQQNLLNPNYTDIGLAIIQGPFQDQPDSNLIVLMMASPLPPGVNAVDQQDSNNYQLTPVIQGNNTSSFKNQYPPQLLTFAIASLTVIFGLFILNLIVHIVYLRYSSLHKPKLKSPNSRLWYH